MKPTATTPQEEQYSGETKPSSGQVTLHAGPLKMMYERGAIRYIRYGKTEILRSVYAAIRNKDWDTVEPVIMRENIAKKEHSFVIDLEVEYRLEDVYFVSNYTFTGSESGKLRFEMKGKCMSSFQKNRIGFCILHPIQECAGSQCTITEPGGKQTLMHFPATISPHQPFMNIAAMQWEVTEAVSAELRFEGDVFETEDQRNWTDASFKTYSTPLALPFPVSMEAGEEINQVVELTLKGDLSTAADVSHEHKPLRFEFLDQLNPLPKIGLGRSSEGLSLTREDILQLRKTGFHHYRIDVKFCKPGWQEYVKIASREAVELGLSLEMALHFTDRYTHEIEELNACLSESKASIYSIILFQENKKTTPQALIQTLVPLLRGYFPSARVGGGTNAYFAELNRQTPPSEHLDFLSYSINPQVHAFDNRSLVETLETQGDTVRNAQRLAQGKDIHISPVTLKPRFNPNATTVLFEEESPESGADSRQMSLFGAGWTLGSIKYLSEAGAKSITYYETVGKKGIFLPNAALDNKIFPVYAVFQSILEESSASVLSSKSSDPLVIDGLVLKTGEGLLVLLANFTELEQVVSLPFPLGASRVIQLDAAILRNSDWLERWNNTSAAGNATNGTVILPPYGLVKVNASTF
jgi:D-apionolactonase